MNTHEKAAAIEAEIATFPTQFGLRSFPDVVFRISPGACYYEGGVVLYLEARQDNGTWLAAVKGSPTELRAQIAR